VGVSEQWIWWMYEAGGRNRNFTIQRFYVSVSVTATDLLLHLLITMRDSKCEGGMNLEASIK
jgi:hypothetical protein